MNFTDTLKVQTSLSGGYDEDGNPIESISQWILFGKEKNSIIFPNEKAAKVSLNDGNEYVYSYVIIAKLKKDLIPLIPKEGQKVYIHKSDGTIDKEMEVKGFVTLKNRYLKIWV